MYFKCEEIIIQVKLYAWKNVIFNKFLKFKPENKIKKQYFVEFHKKNWNSAFYPEKWTFLILPHSTFHKIQKYSMEFRPWNPLFTPIHWRLKVCRKKICRLKIVNKKYCWLKIVYNKNCRLKIVYNKNSRLNLSTIKIVDKKILSISIIVNNLSTILFDSFVD